MADDNGVGALRAEYERHKMAGRTEQCERIEREIAALSPQTTAERKPREKAVPHRPRKR